VTANKSLKVMQLPDGAEIDVLVRRSRRAKSILLQVGNLDGAVELVVPHAARLAEAWEFAQTKTEWLQNRLIDVRRPVPFADGAKFPFLGREIVIRRLDGRYTPIHRSDDELLVTTAPERLPARIQRWLRAQAGEQIKWRVAEKTNQLGRPCKRISIRDQQTRWGSCSASGNLNFSWRLILAPEHVLDYVVAHEVAHLAEMNHGKRFWAHVADLCDDPGTARAWLRTNGMDLHRYGR
jgi:predicted metal-dependent hydrolase